MLLLVPLFGCAFFILVVLPVVTRLYRKCRIDDITPEWLQNFSVACYEPMQDLLAQEDFRFLVRQPGFDLSLYRKLRRERLLIFRQYLGRMINDFNRLHLITRMLIAHGPEDRSDLLSKLMWLKLRFTITVIRTEANYRLCCLGWQSLAVRSLLMQLHEMHQQLSLATSLGATL